MAENNASRGINYKPDIPPCQKKHSAVEETERGQWRIMETSIDILAAEVDRIVNSPYPTQLKVWCDHLGGKTYDKANHGWCRHYIPLSQGVPKMTFLFGQTALVVEYHPSLKP